MRKILLLFLSSFELFAASQIVVYSCYSNGVKVVVEGRLLKYESIDPSYEKDSWWKNGWRKLKQLINDEIKKEPLVLDVGGERFESQSDDEGYFLFEVTLKTPLKEGYHTLKLSMPQKNVQSHAQLLVPPKENRIGIISDFDDTVVVSEVTNKLLLIKNLLFLNYKQREAVEGMANRFREILAKNPQPDTSLLFFITGSPRQLFGSIERFLDYHYFPKRILITKKIHGKESDPLFDQFAYKSARIEEIIALYPHIRWYFFGDSGEKDKEVYTYIQKHYPKHVAEIWIRDVESGELVKR